MKIILSFLFHFLFITAAFCQVTSEPLKLTDPEYYNDGKPMAISVFDSLTQKWKKTEYYRGGAIARETILEKGGFTFTDTSKIFFTNGNLAYKTTWKKNTLTGEFTEFYPEGKIKRRGEYFNFFKTGLWTEYHKNGKKKSEGRYVMTKADSAEKEPAYLDDNRIVYDSIVYPDIGYIDSAEKVVNGKLTYQIYVDSTMVRKDVYMTIPTLKDETWKYWDERGNLLREENYTMGVLEKRKK